MSSAKFQCVTTRPRRRAKGKKDLGLLACIVLSFPAGNTSFIQDKVVAFMSYSFLVFRGGLNSGIFVSRE